MFYVNNGTNINYVHQSQKAGEFLTQDSIDFIRNYASKEYEVIQQLIDLGHLEQDYLTTINNRTSYEY